MTVSGDSVIAVELAVAVRSFPALDTDSAVSLRSDGFHCSFHRSACLCYYSMSLGNCGHYADLLSCFSLYLH